MEQPSENRPPGGWPLWLPALGLVLLTLAVYAQVLGFDFMDVDDNVYVTENVHVLPGLTVSGIGWAFTNLSAGFWHPMTWLSLMLDATLYGHHAAGFHLTNLLLHVGSTVVLFAVLRRMTGAPGRSAIVAALFAVHPLHVEAVAWVAERKEVLGTFFGLLALWAYVRYVEESKIQGPKSKVWYGMSLGLFACALMSKTMMVTLPLLLLLLDYWPLQRVSGVTCQVLGEPPCPLPPAPCMKSLVMEKIPFLVLSTAAGLLTLYAEKTIGAVSPTSLVPMTLRVPNALLSFMRYLEQTVWPAGLAPFYPYFKNMSPALVGFSAVLLVGVTAFALWNLRRRPWLAVGWLWYVVTLLPVSGLIQVGPFARADRFTYVPLIGIFIAAVWAVGDWAARNHQRRIATVAGVAVVAAFAARAYVQTSYWKDSVSLWSHALACAPANYFAEDELGVGLAAQGKLPEAIEHYELALQLHPNYPNAHNDLGLALATQGKSNEAIQQYQQAIQSEPEFAAVHSNLGNALAARGELQQAVEQYKQALQSAPNNADIHVNLGLTLASQKKLDEAMAQYQRALQLDPANAKACYDYGNALATTNRLDEAIQYFQRALALNPNYAKAHNNLGNALTKQGRLGEAILHYEKAARLNPDNIEARFNLANALAALDKPDAAATYLQQALDLATAQNNPALVQTIRARLQQLQATGK